LIERSNDPVTVGIDPPSIIEVESVGVSISDGVEPVAGLVFAETRAFKEFIDET
jgi:hypothetical protein